MRIAVVGCGFVADFYLKTLSAHPQLEVAGVMDQDRDRATRFAEHHSVARYPSLEALQEDPRVDVVLNLTNPRKHFAVSKACLESGKHVYSEKPLAMNLAEAQELVELAERRGLYLSSAPCTLLSESAQTIWKALRDNTVGQVRLAYAEQDAGLVHRMPYRKWFSESGAPWPYRDEFEIGCTIEHAGYYLSWLPAFFGPARRVSAFSSCLIPDKGVSPPLEINAPDYSVASIQFASGVVARLTCSILASRDHSLRLFGDEGILQTDDCWHFGAPVYVRRRMSFRRRSIEIPWRRKLPLVRPWNPPFRYRGSQQMDFSRGVAELAEAIEQGRPCRLSARFCLHVTELTLAISSAGASGASYQISSSFDPIEPTLWARGASDSD